MSSGTIPLLAATTLAAKLVAQLAPYCERIEVAGSVRRQKDIVGDIELVAIPKLETRSNVQPQLTLFGPSPDPEQELVSLLDQQLERMLVLDHDRPIFRSRQALLAALGQPVPAGRDVQRWGAKAKRFYLWGNENYGMVNVDLFLACQDNWGAIFTLRTGPSDFSTAFVTHLLHHTSYRQRGGYLIAKATGAQVPVPEEADYFAAAGLCYVPPEDRTVAALQSVRAGRGDGRRTPGVEGESQSLHEGIAECISPYAFEGGNITDWLHTRLLDAAGVS
jgi:DNA polymerase/3'-5' exonuclease PolX